MAEKNAQKASFKLKDGYSLTKLNSIECSMVFRDSQENTLAILLGCNKKVTAITPYQEYQLTENEISILYGFIKEKNYRINNDVAAILGLSIVKNNSGLEVYMTEAEIKNFLKQRLDGESIYIGKLQQHTLTIDNYSKINQITLSNAKINKLNVGKHCDAQIDIRDNTEITALRVAESFTGSINLSRSTIESIVLSDNCRCNLSVYDSKRCFTLNIGDVYSGNLNIKDSCFHNIAIGYYSYAVIKLTDNWGRRDVVIGDSFRGTLNMVGVNVYTTKIGRDCKGLVTIGNSNNSFNSRNIEIGNEFAGVLDLRSASNIDKISFGNHTRGKINMLGSASIHKAEFGNFFSGYADFSSSGIEYISFGNGCSGDIVLLNCDKLQLLTLPRHQGANLSFERKPIEIQSDNNVLYYHFGVESYDISRLYNVLSKKVKDIFTPKIN